MAVRYCPNCRQNVNGKRFGLGNFLILILTALLSRLIALIYLLYCIFRRPRCPICGINLPDSAEADQRLTVRPEMPEMQDRNFQNFDGSRQNDCVYCYNCGKKNQRSASFCSECGTKLR